jgi:hypothetical protein
MYSDKPASSMAKLLCLCCLSSSVSVPLVTVAMGYALRMWEIVGSLT